MEEKSVVNIELTKIKDTKGTVVFGNEDAGFSIYVPKPFFAAAGVKPDDIKLRMQLTAIPQ